MDMAAIVAEATVRPNAESVHGALRECSGFQVTVTATP
jgi:hypothetical protein